MMSKKKNAIALSVWSVCAAAILAGSAFVSWYATTWDKALGPYLGYVGGTEVAAEDIDSLVVKQKDLELRIVDEGCVLLKNNNNALPLSKGNKVSVFGMSSMLWMDKQITVGKTDVLLQSLKSAGLETNDKLAAMYMRSKHTNWGNGANLGDGAIAGNWQLDEVPQSEYTDAVKASYADFSDAAIVVFTRGGSEGGDLPRYMGRYGGSDEESYLELNKDEKDLLAAIKASGKFKKTIVILHTTNAMQMDFDKEEYGIDSILWVSGTGQDGVEEIGKLLTGEVNPSAKNVDTYVYDNFSAPAMQNFGDYRFTENGELVKDYTTTVGGTYSYLNYGEGIYMGYKYYETRYEDAVMKSKNVGSYDYASTVYAPFGYGLSYTTFGFSDFKMGSVKENGDVELSVKVTNTGNVAGKQVVQFYYQAPYTDYDKQNGVEKAAVNLIDFGKTKLLDAGKSETVSVTINVNDFASYDANKAKTYLLEAGEYFITAASDAHEATNNILSAKGYTKADGMTAEGNAKMVASYEQKSTERKDQSVTGYTITNIFDDAKLPDAKYLSRSNWSVMDSFDKTTLTGGVAYATGTKALGTGSGTVSNTMDVNGTVGIKEASADILKGLKTVNWSASGNPVAMDSSDWAKVSYDSKSTSYKLEDMEGVPYDDKKWDDLVNQMSQAEQVDLVGRSGWGNAAFASVGKPQTFFMDGPQGMIDYVSGGVGYQFTDENLLGATWNKQLAAEEGELISLEFALKGASMWWAPAINLHRTAFSGRNFEYFSEDGIHSGLMAMEEVVAARKNGVKPTLKHFFLNDQETNRGANGRVATFADEQTLREIYAKPFQIAIEKGGASNMMSTMCRIGTKCLPASYAVNTILLRNEWGLQGTVITDAQSFTENEAEMALAAGCDMVCANAQTKYLDSTLKSAGGQYMLHEAAKNILYSTANSCAMGMDFNKGFAIYKLAIIALNVFVVLYLAYGTMEVLVKCYPEQKVISSRAKWIIRIVLWTIAAAVLTYLVVMLATTWWADLMFALQTAV